MTKNKSFISELFEQKSVFQSYLDVEAALARSQAELGVIPQWAADMISEKAKIELLNLDNVHSGLKKRDIHLCLLSGNWIEFVDPRQVDIFTGEQQPRT